MTYDPEHRARLQRIIDLTEEALVLCDQCGDHMMAAKLADSLDLATNRLAALGAD